jgi:hypothetical protein
MTRKEVIIGQGRLDVIRTYLADKAPEGVRQHQAWTRCMNILSAQRKEAPAQQGTPATDPGDDNVVVEGQLEYLGAHYDPDKLPPPTPPQFVTQGELDALTKRVERVERGVSKCKIEYNGHIMWHGEDEPVYATREELENERQTSIAAFLGVDHTIDELRGEVAAVSDQIRMHCREPHMRNESRTCSTCHHHPVCQKAEGITTCESWEGRPR